MQYTINRFFRFPRFFTSQTLLMAGILATFYVSTPTFAYTTIGSQLDLGENNVDVTTLQQFLTTRPDLYPSGLVSGYYGTLTQAAVIKFQTQYGIAEAGRVGPDTRDKMNMLISGGTIGSTVENNPGHNTIGSQLDLGEANSNVTNLQHFLSTMPSIYPSGLVTGYFGTMTQAAVVKFQTMYGLSPVGRVGPETRDKMNSLIVGSGEVVYTPTNPIISSVYQSVTQSSAVFSWNTNVTATGKVFYYTSPITMNEGDINSVGFGSTNGFVASNDNMYRTTQQVNINNLQSNTLYYYVIVATDQSGNVSVVGPNNTFRTNP